MPDNCRIKSIEDGDFRGKRVLLRVDINSPVDTRTKKITNDNRIEKSVPTIRCLLERGAKVVIIAHQGDSTDYRSLISLREHSEKLSRFLKIPVDFIEDLAGPAALERIKGLKPGEILLLENLRFYAEEVSTFEDSVKLLPDQMTGVHYVKKLTPLFDYYVNDAFSAAHRNSPSMVAFQKLLPSYGGRLLIRELDALSAVTGSPKSPCVYVLGGSRAGDAFGMIQRVLEDNRADYILTGGLVGHIFMHADGLDIGTPSETHIKNKGYEKHIDDAKGFLKKHRDKIFYPVDVAFEKNGKREEMSVENLPPDTLIYDIGKQTVTLYKNMIVTAKTIFVNGPVGVYEEAMSAESTEALWKAVENAPGFTVIGGGDTVTSFMKYTDIKKINYVSTAGGALIRYLSGMELPLLKAMQQSGAD